MLQRRAFLQNTIKAAGAWWLAPTPFALMPGLVKLCAHPCLCAGNASFNCDAMPLWDKAFAGIKEAGFEGIELVAASLHHDDAVSHISALIKKYRLQVSGTLYSADIWVRERHDAILQDVVLVTNRLQQLGGGAFTILAGNARRNKTTDELKIQTDTLNEIVRICTQRNIVPALYNYAYEPHSELNDLEESLEQVPDIKLALNLGWLVQAGLNPVDFIEAYSSKIVCLHLSTQDANGAWPNALGQDTLDFDALAKALKKVNFSGCVVIKSNCNGVLQKATAYDWKQSRAFMRRKFGW